MQRLADDLLIWSVTGKQDITFKEYNLLIFKTTYITTSIYILNTKESVQFYILIFSLFNMYKEYFLNYFFLRYIIKIVKNMYGFANKGR